MISIGICASPDKAGAAKRVGYDYIELNLSATAAMTDAEYAAAKDRLSDAGIRAEAFNVMVPGAYRLTGPDADLAPVREYLDKAIPRAAEMGCRVIVFGSGAARHVPERYAAYDAWTQLTAYLKLAASVARGVGITIAVEPLSKRETNIIHTVREGAALAAAVNEPNVGALGDTYHMYAEGEPYTAFIEAKDRLLHVHTAENVTRAFPSAGDGTDYAGLFAALKAAGYNARVSVEGSCKDFEAEAAAALEVLRGARG
ncbi:MAG: sugar phosphate isomerase/epimerase [Oscillospiraceae bacterium]|jgi:sugar phosphate isomerase/epimerase|nr:sugar phosphate isomerase/epimerase [Oscillospiraceae bacterium]